MEDKDIEKIGETKLSTVVDPFTKDSIEEILVVYRKNTFRGNWYAYGTVEFKNGKTKGEQRFDGETFDEVALLIKNFIQNEL